MISHNSINYWTMPSVRKQKLNPRQREAIANDIIAKICTYYNITNEQIRGKKRYRTKLPIVPARHMAMYIIRKKLNLKLKHIADLFGRDHTTVIHGIRSVKNLSDTEERVKQELNYLINIL